VTPRCQGRDPIIFEPALKLFNFCNWPTQLTQLIYTDFTVSYRDALDRLRVVPVTIINYHQQSATVIAMKDTVKHNIT